MRHELRLATRGSNLALTQAEWVAARLRLAHPTIEIRLEIIKTTGDKSLDVQLSKIGGKGLFAKEIEDALLDGRADFAVHSLKDLPTDMPEGLTLAAMTEREDPRDVLSSRSGAGLEDLPEGAMVGTSSLRRSAQLAHHRPDLRFKPIRGNVETRLRKLAEDDELDAIVLAAAGILRLGLEARVTQWLPPEICLPAAGQGILAIQTRSDDPSTTALLAPLASSEGTICGTAERAALGRLGGGCQTPIGLLAQVRRGECVVDGVVTSESGAPYYRCQAVGDAADPAGVGTLLAERLLDAGAADLIHPRPSGS